MIKISNKKIGEDFEKELLDILKDHGFWATKLKEKEMGGPLDIVATKNNEFYSFEAKHLKGTMNFTKERIEPNQIRAYRRLFNVGSDKYAYFVYKTDFGTFLLHSSDVIENRAKSIDISKGIKLEDWLKDN